MQGKFWQFGFSIRGGEALKDLRDFLELHAIVGFDLAHDIIGHVRYLGISGVLDDNRPAARFDRQRARAAVIERARKYHGHHTLPIRSGRAAEESIDRGAMAIFARPHDGCHATRLNHEVAIWRREINFAGADGFGFVGMDNFK